MRPVFRAMLCAVTALLLPSIGEAQIPAPANADLFGDEAVRSVKLSQAVVLNGFMDQGGAVPEKDPNYRHMLIFHDRRQLRGRVASITQDEIVFVRPGASEPLRLPKHEIRRIVLSEGAIPRVTSSSFRVFSTEEVPHAQ